MKDLNLAIEMLLIYLQGIWLRRRYIILTAWVVCPLGWLGVFNLPPTYQADAKLYVETRSVLDPVLAGLALMQPNPDQELELMAKSLLSRPNLEKIARATDLDVQAPDAHSYEKLIDDLQNGIKFSRSGRENIYLISYSNASSPMALKVVQETLNTFVESQVGSAAADNKKASEFLESQIKDYETRLTEAEKRLSEFKKEQIAVGPTSDVNFYTRIESEKERLEEARLQLKQTEKQLDSARKQLQGETAESSSSDGAATGFSSQYDERIKALQNQLDALLIRYTDSHPDVRETKRLLENLQQLRKDEIAQLRQNAASSSPNSAMAQNQVYQELRLNVAKLENEVESQRVRVANYQEKVDTLERQRNIIPDIEAKFSGLNRDYEITKAKYEELLSRREAIDLTQKKDATSQEVQFKIIEPPRVPFKPSGPPRILLYTVVLVLGVFAGLFMAFARSQFQPVVTSALQLKMISDFPVFGLVSHTDKETLLKQNRRHLWYFVGLSMMLVTGYTLFIVNELVFGITAVKIWERLL